MTRTSLDDAEYAKRFERLNGAISNLSFNIRKNWKGVPPWLGHVCNKDAHIVGTKEMTAIGRACITKWIVDCIFDRFFHPGLDPTLSAHLKIIEKNLRRAGQNPYLSHDQRDDITTKVVNWRLVTVDGLQDVLASPQSYEYTATLIREMSDHLISSLQDNLTEPAPPGLDNGVISIIELAIGIASHLPLESRDVYLDYPLPGSLINETYMKLEPGMTPLVNPGLTPQQAGAAHQDYDQAEQGSLSEAPESLDTEQNGGNMSLASPRERDPISIENEIREASVKATATQPNVPPKDRQGSQSAGDSNTKPKKSGGLLASLVSKKPPQLSGRDRGGDRDTRSMSAGSGITSKEMQPPLPPTQQQQQDKDSRSAGGAFGMEAETGVHLRDENRIRFAAFASVEVRGKTAIQHHQHQHQQHQSEKEKAKRDRTGGGPGPGVGADVGDETTGAAGRDGQRGGGDRATGGGGAGGRDSVNVLVKAPVYGYV